MCMWNIGRRTNGRGAKVHVLGENTVFHFIHHKSHRNSPWSQIRPANFNLRAVRVGFVLDKVLFPLSVVT